MSSGAQMLAGGLLLAVAAALFGEFQGFHPSTVSPTAWFSLLYLIIAGSIIGFTAYLWLMHHESPTKVGTYAYVNPIVAVLLGYFLASEPLGARTVPRYTPGSGERAGDHNNPGQKTANGACSKRDRVTYPSASAPTLAHLAPIV